MDVREDLKKFVVGDIPTLMYIPEFVTGVEHNQLLSNIYGAPLSKWKTLKNRRLQNWGGVVHEKGLLPQDLPSWLVKITRRINEQSGLYPSAINHVLINEYHPNQGIMPHQDGPAYFPVVAILSLGSPVVMEFTPHSRHRAYINPMNGSMTKQSPDGEVLAEETDKWEGNHHPFSVLLMPRSLLIFKDDAYSDYLHGIKDSNIHQNDGVINETEALSSSSLGEEAVEVIRDGDTKIVNRSKTRVSLTCRLVLKVHKNLIRL